MTKLRVGLDATPLTKPKAGIGVYIYHLLEELLKVKTDCEFFLYAQAKEGDLAYFEQFPNVTIRTNSLLSQSHSVWAQTTLAFLLSKDKIDAFWATNQSFPLLKRKEMKVLFTLHDFVYKLYPKTVSSLKCMIQRALTPSMIRRADYLLTNSKGTAARLKEYYGVEHHAIVEPPIKPWLKPIDLSLLRNWLSQKGLTYKGYLLTVGTIEPRKNFETILGAFSLVADQALPLVIIGGEGWKHTRIMTLLENLKEKYPKKIILTGYAQEEDQWHYIAGARYLVMMSHYEGYGLPIAEARTCGTEIVCSDVPEMREAALERGIFLPKENLANQLAPYFLPGDDKVAKPENRYPTNREKVQPVAAILDKIK